MISARYANFTTLTNHDHRAPASILQQLTVYLTHSTAVIAAFFSGGASRTRIRISSFQPRTYVSLASPTILYAISLLYTRRPAIRYS